MMRWRDEFSPDFITNYFIITYMIQRGIWIILSAIPRCIKISSDSLEDLE